LTAFLRWFGRIPRGQKTRSSVHFSLVGQPYMFGVSITNTGPVRVAGSYLEASCSVSLVIKSDLLSPDEISSRVGLEPSHTQKKDVPNRPGASAPTNSWVLKGKHEHCPADVVIPEFIEMLESAGPRLLAIAALADTDLYVAVTYHGNVDWMWGIHLEASTLRRLTALGAALDLDLYASGPALPSEAIRPVD
jgi:hypothetical protein